MRPNLSILVISYNTREMTIACLRSILEQTASAMFEVLVVDNASTDGSAAAVAAAFPEARLIPLAQNIGFAAANNLAAQEARGEFLLLLNPDTVVLDRAIERLHAFAVANPQASIFGGRTVFADGSLNPGSCWRRPTPWSMVCAGLGLSALFRRSRLFASESYGPWKRDSVRRVDIVSGCFLLIRRELWDRLGGFDPAFFMYGEEADLCLRAGNLGATCLIQPDAAIIHYGGASERVKADKMVRLFRAKAMLVRRHWRAGSHWIGIRSLDAWAFTRMVGYWLLGRGSPRRLESYQTWVNVWGQRAQWRQSGCATAAVGAGGQEPAGAPAASAEA